MKVFLCVVLAILGSANGLVPGFQYVYDYESHIGTGIPEIRSSAAGASMKCKVNVKVEQDTQITVQLSEIEVGEFVGDVDCELRDAMPVRYKPASGAMKLLEQPYMMQIQKYYGAVMQVPKDDPMWVSNLRKGIVTAFLVQPIRRNMGDIKGDDSVAKFLHGARSIVPPGFSVQEPNILGNCRSDYTMSPLTLPEQSQNQSYKMERTVDFSNCKDQTFLQETAMGNTSQARENQYHSVHARSSVLMGNLTFDSKYYRLINASIVGTFVVNPFGTEADKLMSISNQTLIMRSEEPVHSSKNVKAPAGYKDIDTWFMQFRTPYAKGDNAPEWMIYDGVSNPEDQQILQEYIATGLDPKATAGKQMKDRLLENLDSVVNLMQSQSPVPQPGKITPFMTKESQFITSMEACSRLVRALSYQELQEVFDTVKSKRNNESPIADDLKLRLYIDTLAASGVSAPIKVIIDRAQKQEISLNRTASIFFTMSNNLLSTPIIDKMTEFVKKLSLDQNPFLTTTIWINYAKALNRACLNDRKRDYSVPHQLYGKQQCNSQSVVNGILPFFEDQLQRANSPWKQMAIVHAIGNLGTVQILNTVDKVIKSNLYSQVRGDAVYALSGRNLPQGARAHVFQTLSPLVFNVTEDIYVRQSAVAALLSWDPSPSFYQRLAALSWRDPSNNMASFIYFLLDGLAHNQDPVYDRQTRSSRFALPITKPYYPSMRYSYSFLFSKFAQKEYISTDFEFSSMRDSLSVTPRNLYTFIINSFGGYRFKVFEAAISKGPSSIVDMLSKAVKSIPNKWKSLIRSPLNRKAQQIFDDLDQRMVKRDYPTSQVYSNLYLSFMDNLELLLPLSENSIRDLARGASEFLKYLQSQNGYNMFLSKYINPAPIDFYLPTESGVPVLARLSTPTAVIDDGRAVLTADGKNVTDIYQLVDADQILLNATSDMRFVTKTFTSLRFLMPWSEKSALVGLEAQKAVSLPVTFKLNITGQSSSLRNISLSFIPTYTNEYPVVHAHTIPFLAIKNIWPGDEPQEIMSNMKVISAKGDFSGVIQTEIPLNRSYTGVDGKIQWEGDRPYPFTLGNIVYYVYQHPEKLNELLTSPHSQISSLSLSANFGSSATKEIHPSLAYKWPSSQNPDRIQEPAFRIGTKDSSNEYALYTNVLLNGTESRYFENSIRVQPRQQSESTQSYEIDVVTARNPLPGFDPKPAAFCLSLQETSPAINSLEQLRQALKSTMEVKIDGKLRGGSSCTDLDIAQIQASLKLSDERQKKLWKEMNSACNYDPSDPMVVFRTAPVYDQAALSIDYKEPVPRTLQNATYLAYDMIRGFAFPHIYFNYMDINNPPSKIHVRGNRYLSDLAWNVRAELPTETIEMDDVLAPSYIDQILPIFGLSPQRHSNYAYTPKILYDSQVSHQCIITKNKVRNFDGFTLKHRLEHCDTYAAVDRSDIHEPVVQAAVEQDTKNMKAVIGSQGDGFTMVLNSTTLYTDGKEIGLTRERKVIKDKEGRFFAEALKTPTYMEIIVPNNFTAKVFKDKIVVTPAQNKHGRFGGLCGDFNGAKHKELIGPKNCIYSDEALYGYAWTTFAGVGCSWDEYKRERDLVEKFQKDCPKVEVSRRSTVLPKYDPIPSDCLEFVYKVKKYDESLCVSHDVVAICHPLCKKVHVRDYNEIFDCWPESVAPREIEKALKRGYIRNKIHRRPIVQTAFSTEHAEICQKS